MQIPIRPKINEYVLLSQIFDVRSTIYPTEIWYANRSNICIQIYTSIMSIPLENGMKQGGILSLTHKPTGTSYQHIHHASMICAHGFVVLCYITTSYCDQSWWRYQMETFSALLALCAGNSPVTGEFHAQRPVTRSFDIVFDLHLNERLSKQSRGWWYETLLRSLWRHRNVKPYPSGLFH